MDEKQSSILRDQETGLPNRPLILDRLQMNMAFCRRYQMSMAVCYTRIAYPPEINHDEDTQIVTSLKKMIVERLHQCIRDIDSVGVFNETDLLILLTDVSKQESEAIIKRIIGFLSGSYKYKQRNILLGVNIGICMFPYDRERKEDLITMAKAEMFQAIEEGINQASFFKGDIHDSAYRKAMIDNELHYAIKDQQLKIVYQPQIEIHSLKMVGVEALLRWEHPTLGSISPAEFIPLAEASGNATDMFYWLLKNVCQSLKSKGNTDILNIKFSLNLSINQLLIPNFVQSVSEICQEFGVDPETFTFEVTENIRLYQVDLLKERLRSLRACGFSIALDDFGHGYFSFSDLISLPLDYIKFDKSFVTSLIHNHELKPIISPIIEMAHNLGLKVIVEGIENVKEYHDWKSLNGDIVQGYLFSEPVSFECLSHPDVVEKLL